MIALMFFVILFVWLCGYIYPSFITSRVSGITHDSGCYFSKEYVFTNLDFYECHYFEEDIRIKSMKNNLIGDKVEIVKSTISNYLTNQSDAEKIEFNYDNVTADDYYVLKDDGLSFYDVDKNILYDFCIKTSNLE